MNGMKRIIILFLINLLIVISSFSQTIYPKQINDSLVIITTQQLKQSNLIFVEHDKLKRENVELTNKIDIQKQMLTNCQKLDSLRLLKEQDYQLQIDNLNKQIKSKSKSSLKKGILIGGVCGVSITSLIFLLAR